MNHCKSFSCQIHNDDDDDDESMSYSQFSGLAYIQTNQFIPKCALQTHFEREYVSLWIYSVAIQDWWHIPGWTLFYLQTVIEVSPHLSSTFSFVISHFFFPSFFSHCSFLGNSFNASVVAVQWAPIHRVLTHFLVVSIHVVSLLFWILDISFHEICCCL